MGSLLAFIIFPTALAALIAAANYFLESARKIGVSVGIRPFIMGAFILAFGTSFPEAAIALFSVLNGSLTIPVAQVVGSNIANILLVLGISALLARKFNISKNLIDVELPLLAAATFLLVLIAFDGTVHLYEGLILCIGFIIYTVYIAKAEDNKSYPTTIKEQLSGLAQIPKEILLFIVTAILIAVASHFIVASTKTIAALFTVPESVIAITALALGTSLPELVVSIQAALRNEIELVIGNVIGSNIFNILFVIGIPALISNLTVDPVTVTIGIPVLIGVTALFIISGIANRIHIWEALFYILLYILLIGILIG